MLKNFFFLWVCDGHGKCGHFISDHAKLYIPANIQYLEIEKNVEKHDKDLSSLFKNLFTLNECSDVKETNMIKYLYDKFGVNASEISFVKRSLKDINSTLTEAFIKANDDLKNRDFDLETSGSTVCTVFICGKSLFCANLGDSRAILGSYIEQDNIWNVTQLTKDHKPDEENELKRIEDRGGRVGPYRNENNVESGPPRVWLPNEDSPGLAMSRSIGDTLAAQI